MPVTDYRINLAHQQAECALNYARILRLLPQLAEEDNWLFGLPTGERMRFIVRDRSPYTTTLTICHSADRIWSITECQVRVYHDAQMVEVVAFQGQWRIKALNDYPNPDMHHIDEKAQWNNFLGEWLAHCLAHGHLEYDLPADVDMGS